MRAENRPCAAEGWARGHGRCRQTPSGENPPPAQAERRVGGQLAALWSAAPLPSLPGCVLGTARGTGTFEAQLDSPRVTLEMGSHQTSMQVSPSLRAELGAQAGVSVRAACPGLGVQD